jgi:hypothetical protein
VDDSGKVVIRSFRLVFDRGYRRLFKIDRYRLPFAYGLPILGIFYAALVALALVIAAKLPVAGPALAALPPPIHWVAIPVGLSMVMLHWRPDGLKPHAALWGWLEAALTARDLSCWQPAERDADQLELGEIACAPDGREGRYRPGRVSGPAEVLLATRRAAGSAAGGCTSSRPPTGRCTSARRSPCARASSRLRGAGALTSSPPMTRGDSRAASGCAKKPASWRTRPTRRIARDDRRGAGRCRRRDHSTPRSAATSATSLRARRPPARRARPTASQRRPPAGPC